MGRIGKWGGKEKLVTQLITDYGIEKIQYQVEHLKRKQKEKAKIKDNFAWFRKAIKENYADPVQEGKKKKEQAFQNRKEQQQQKKNTEKQLIQLKSEKYQQEKDLTNSLLLQTPTLLQQTLDDLKSSSSTIRRALQNGHTPDNIYKNIRFQGLIINKIKASYEAEFALIEADFQYKQLLLSQ